MVATGNTLAYQWKKNGAPLNGATAESLTLSFVTAADMGFYSVLIKSNEVSIESDLAVLTVTSPTVSRLINLSTRGHVPPGGSLTPGFTLRGTGATELLVRGVGPTLARFGVGGACIDPTLELIPAGESTPFFTNDDWSERPDALRVAAATAAVGAFALDTGSTDAAVLASFDSAVQRNYTARVMPKHPDASGIVLAELYATGAANSPVQLAAVSMLGHAGTGERTLVSGFTIEGTAPKRLLIRAVGPGLDQFGVRDTLSDPRLTLVPAGETSAIAGNDNWESNTAVTRATAMAGAFPLVPGSNDAALVVLLPPGGYTVTLSGQDGATGIALMEIYDLDR